ncbi:MAG: hypothetical protein ABSF50_06170 [Burkholderiaceae bacterium]
MDNAQLAARSALQLKPGDAELENLLGLIVMGMGRFEEAADHFHRAIQAMPDFAAPIINLIGLDHQFGAARAGRDARPVTEAATQRLLDRLTEAFRNRTLDANGVYQLIKLTVCDRKTFPIAIDLVSAIKNPEQLGLEVVTAFAQVYTYIGDVERFRQLVELAHQMAPSAPGTRQGLGQALVAEGGARWSEGWKLLTEAWRGINPTTEVSAVPEWRGEALNGERLFVYQEQGVGDTLLALRLLRPLMDRGIDFVLQVSPQLAELVATGTGATSVVTVRDPLAYGCTYAAPLLGLMSILNLDRAAARHPATIAVPASRKSLWQKRIDAMCADRRGHRIGLVALGNPSRSDDWLRSIPIEELQPLAGFPGITWVNLSVDERPEQDALRSLLPIINIVPEISSFADTAAIIAELEAVVAIDCSVAHLAASLGKPVWLLAGTQIEWRWQIADDLKPWWPTVTVIRAQAPGIWHDAIANLSIQLGRFVDHGGVADIEC